MELSRDARVRSAWMDFYPCKRNAARICRNFSISHLTFYRWQRRYEPFDLSTLESRSHRPDRQRQSTWTFPLAEKVLTLRLSFPAGARTNSRFCCAAGVLPPTFKCPTSPAPSENSQSIKGYDAYFGTYTIDETSHTVTHHLEGALAAADVGKNLVREFQVSGDRLTIIVRTNSPKQKQIRTLIWERVR
jgi:hypothetical protein